MCGIEEAEFSLRVSVQIKSNKVELNTAFVGPSEVPKTHFTEHSLLLTPPKHGDKRY